MNAIQISDVTIQQTNNLYCLNDLHKASGGASKHQPAFWLRQQQIQEVIAELQAEGREVVKVVNGGKNRGTFVCKELVYAYATWISAKFFLLVIRTFDALVSGSLKAKTTVDERTGLRDAVNLLVSKKGLNYPEAYNMVHQRFNVESIEDLSHSQLNQAVEYVHRIILEGEVLDKEPALPEYPRNLLSLLHHAEYVFQWLMHYEPAIRLFNNRLAGGLIGRARDGYCCAFSIAQQIGFKLQSHQYWGNYPYDGDYDTTENYRKLYAA